MNSINSNSNSNSTNSRGRLLIEDLPSPVPLETLLPDVYRRFDENIVRFTMALDEVIAPIWSTLDCFDAYLDPALAPDDFVEMLANWVGLTVDHNWSDKQARNLVMQAVELYRWRGTRRGIVALVESYCGITPVITESGGTSVSTLMNPKKSEIAPEFSESATPAAPAPVDSGNPSNSENPFESSGFSASSVKVSLELSHDDLDENARMRLKRLILDNSPAHVFVQVEFTNAPTS